MAIKFKHFILYSFITCLIGCTSSVAPKQSETMPGADKKLVASNANIQLGMNYLQAGDVNKAKQKLLMALELTPKYPAAWYTMAYYYEVTGDYKQANEYYLQAIKLAPNSGDTHNNYGTFLCHSGKPKEAIDHFLQATQDNHYIDHAAAFENAGLCALHIPDKQQAKDFFSKALKRDPQRARSLALLANVQYELGEYRQAQDSLEQLKNIAKPTPETEALGAKIASKMK